MKMYYALSPRVLRQISIRNSAILMAAFPWVCDSEESMSKIMKSVDDSPFGTALVLDSETGKPIFTLTNNEEAINKCKKRPREPSNEDIFSCEQNCKAQHPTCAVLIVVVTVGGCTCICDNTDVLETQGGDFWEQNQGPRGSIG